jgi:hypothetical protein
MTALESRVESMDIRGTRGMEGVRVIQVEMAKDIGKLEEKMDAVSRKLDGASSTARQRMGAFVLVALPMWVTLLLVLAGVHV